MAILRKEFERQYGINLLPVSAADIHVGDIWDWQGVFHPILKRMFSNIALVGDNKDTTLYEDMKNVPLVNAHIPDIEMKDKTTVSADLKVPSIGLDLSSDLAADKVISFKFQNMASKDVSGMLQSRIVDFLTRMKTSEYKVYGDAIKNNNVVMWLFYSGAVTLEVDKSITNKDAIDAKINGLGTNVKVDTTSSASIKYTIAVENGCPFAAQFIKGRDI